MSRWVRTEKPGVAIYTKTWTRWDALLWRLHVRRTFRMPVTPQDKP